MTRTPTAFGPVLAALLAGAGAGAQTPGFAAEHAAPLLPNVSQIVVPQTRSFWLDAARSALPVRIEAVHAHVRIADRTARTELQVLVRNPSQRQEEAVLLLPVPRGAAISGFDFDGAGTEPGARLLPRDEARATYDAIVARLRDPALLEFVDQDLVRSSVFPVPPGGTQRILLRYEQLLEQQGARIDYVLPRSESLQQEAPWTIDVELHGRGPICSAFSPSHELVTKRLAADRLHLRSADSTTRTPGSFRLSWLLQDARELTASLFAYPDPALGGGYFLLMAGLPQRDATELRGLRREVTIVLDRSGSMSGGKLDQARTAALQVIEGLDGGESFQIVDYASDVARFAPAAVRKSPEAVAQARAYLAGVRPGGGTNIHDALVESLRPIPAPESLGIVLFLTDGLPTVGRTAERDIRALVESGNRHHRRVFTFGVGHDVNAPLLDRVAELSRATSTYVIPGEDVEVKVAQVFHELYGPVLSDLELTTTASDGTEDTRRVRDLEPRRLRDLFHDDQLVVLGRYVGEAPLEFRLAGDWLGDRRRFAFRFDLDRATTRNAFVPRLWASRRIATLIDDIRQAGGDALGRGPAPDPFADPRLRELREEIVALSARFGVLSEYTSFLATEGTDLGDWTSLVSACGSQLDGRAVRTRSGAAATNQALNIQAQRAQMALNPRNAYWDAELERVEFGNVQQICDRAFFQRGPRWIDGRLVQDNALQPTRTIHRGSAEHAALLQSFVEQHRNGVLSLPGEILTRVGDEIVLVVD
ncbi:MAG: VWA domain-containing protein [Planctomycetes bacterium]|nr:VWA domain-containing protein [Planctomycetota bacterium]